MNFDRILMIALEWLERHGRTTDGDRLTLTPPDLMTLSDLLQPGGPAAGLDVAEAETRLAELMPESGRMPRQFVGVADGGERYRCRDHGCPCGWVCHYAPGEPMAAA
jgi:hypothetical protein